MTRTSDPPPSDPADSLSGPETESFSPHPRVPPTPDEVRPLGRGATLGRYTVLDLLGEGGMGRVYSTYDPKLDRKVAVKLLSPRRRTSSLDDHRLVREARALARLSHPNVITVYDVTTVGDRVLLAMEFIRGVTLKAWLDRRQRTRQEILEVFLQAGEGLAASHRAGLVHRDFKTSNVMVSDEGRVVVLDFGLARATHQATEGPVVDADLLEHHGGAEGALLALEPTRTGAVVGTPAFMAPEQRAGASVGPAADQYSFCVALHQALQGRSHDPRTTASNAISSRLVGEIPSTIENALRRGLETQPEDRFPTLRALLRELAGRPAARQRRLGLVAILSCLGLLAWLGSGSTGTPSGPLCKGARDQLEAVWDPEDSQRLRQIFANSEVPFAEASWRATETALDAYAEAWIRQHTEACEATHRRGEQSVELLDRRMACLDHRRRELGALVDLLGEGEPTVVRRAPRAALALSALEACDDTEALLAPPAQRLTPEVRQRVEALQDQLSRSKARHDAGRYRQAFEIARAVASDAEELGFWPLIARAQLRLGVGHGALEDPEQATAALDRSRLAAQVGRLPQEAAEALVRQVRVVGYQQRRFEQAHRLARHAQALVDQLDRGEALAATLADYQGAVFLQQGELDQAADRHTTALIARRRLLGDHHPEVARTRTRLGNVRLQQGRFTEALEQYQQALAIHGETYGEDHPVVAHALDQVGRAAFNRGEYQGAQTHHERALAIHRRLAAVAGGDDTDPAVGHTLGDLGNAFSAQGRSQEAIEHYLEALAIYEAAYGPEHPHVAIILSNLGLESYGRGEGVGALDYYRRALTIQEASYGPEHPSVAMTLFNQAGVEHYLLGRWQDALDHYEGAIRRWHTTHGKDFHLAASAELGRGLVLHRLGRSREGLEICERAVQTLAAHSEDPAELAGARFELARLLVELGREPERARALSIAARDGLSDRPEHHELLSEISAWLADPPDPRTETDGPESPSSADP